MNAEDILPPGYWVGEYEIEQVIGRGSMGIAYRAKQAALGRPVCIKFLRPDRTNHPTFVQKFEAEARALAGLSHPNILVVFQLGVHEGMYYMVTELVDGSTLFDLIEKQSLKIPDFIRIVSAVGDALQYIHDQGVLHRDIKPGNILINKRGHVKLADFGIAKILVGGGVTSTGSVGTENYQAPEVDAGRTYDHRADIFSLAVTFYRMMTGQFPGMGRRIEQFNPDIPPAVDEILGCALAFNPALRYPSVEEFCTELIGVLKGERIVIKEPTSDPKSGELPTRLATDFLMSGEAAIDGPGSTPAPSSPRTPKTAPAPAQPDRATPSPAKQIAPPVPGAVPPPPSVPSRLAKRDDVAAPRSRKLLLAVCLVGLLGVVAAGSAVLSMREKQQVAAPAPPSTVKTPAVAAAPVTAATTVVSAAAVPAAVSTSDFEPFENSIPAEQIDDSFLGREVAVVGQIKQVLPSQGPRVPTRLILTEPSAKTFAVIYWEDDANTIENGRGTPRVGTMLTTVGKIEAHRDQLQVKLKKKSKIRFSDGPVAVAAAPAAAVAEPARASSPVEVSTQSDGPPPTEQMVPLARVTAAAPESVSTALPTLEPWRVEGKLAVPGDYYTFLEMLPNGDLLAATTNNSGESEVERAVYRITVPENPAVPVLAKPVRRDRFASQRGYSGLAVGPDGNSFVSADTGEPGTSFVARLTLDDTIATSFGDQGVIRPGHRCLGIASDGMRLFVLIDWGRVLAFDPATGAAFQEEYQAGSQFLLRDIAYEPTGRQLFGFGKGQLVTWKIGASGTVPATFTQTLFAENMVRSTEGIGIDPTGPAAVIFPIGKREMIASNGANEPQVLAIGEPGDAHFVDIAFARSGKLAFASNLRQKEISVLRRGAAAQVATAAPAVATAAPVAAIGWMPLSDEAFTVATTTPSKGILIFLGSGDATRDMNVAQALGITRLAETGGTEFVALRGQADSSKTVIDNYKPAKFPILLVLDGTGKEVARFHEGDTSHEAMFTLKILKGRK